MACGDPGNHILFPYQSLKIQNDREAKELKIRMSALFVTELFENTAQVWQY